MCHLAVNKNLKNKLKINTGVIKVLNKKVTFDERVKRGRELWLGLGQGAVLQPGWRGAGPGASRGSGRCKAGLPKDSGFSSEGGRAIAAHGAEEGCGLICDLTPSSGCWRKTAVAGGEGGVGVEAEEVGGIWCL